MENEKYLKVDEAAELVNVSPWTVRKWIKERMIPSYRFGGAVRIREKDLYNFAKVTSIKIL